MYLTCWYAQSSEKTLHVRSVLPITSVPKPLYNSYLSCDLDEETFYIDANTTHDIRKIRNLENANVVSLEGSHCWPPLPPSKAYY